MNDKIDQIRAWAKQYHPLSVLTKRCGAKVQVTSEEFLKICDLAEKGLNNEKRP